MNGKAGQGFTLLELLVVLAILSVAVTLVVLQPGLAGGQRALRMQADAVLEPLLRICDEAVLTARPWGVWLGAGQWRVLTRLQGRWQWPGGEQDRGALPRQPEPVFTVGGRVVDPEPWPQADEAVAPQVICLPQGLRTPVEIHWRDASGQTRLRIELQADGQQQWYWPE